MRPNTLARPSPLRQIFETPARLAVHAPGQLAQVLAVLDRARFTDLPKVLDPQSAFPFPASTDRRPPHLDEMSLHVTFEPHTDRVVIVVVGPCHTAAVYRDGELLGLCDADHPRFAAHLGARRFPTPLASEYRIGPSTSSITFVHRP